MDRSFVALLLIIYLSLTPSFGAAQTELDKIDAEKAKIVEKAKNTEKAKILEEAEKAKMELEKIDAEKAKIVENAKDAEKAKLVVEPNAASKEESCYSPCPRIYEPVCDSKGRTHNNYCNFKVQYCLDREKVSLKIVHQGRCEDKEKEVEISEEDNAASKEEAESCTYWCSKIFYPVCDSNGETHANYCKFRQQQCLARKKGQFLKKVHDGGCEVFLCGLLRWSKKYLCNKETNVNYGCYRGKCFRGSNEADGSWCYTLKNMVKNNNGEQVKTDMLRYHKCEIHNDCEKEQVWKSSCVHSRLGRL